MNIALLSLTLPSALLGAVVMLYSTYKAGGLAAFTTPVLTLAAQGPVNTLQLFGGITLPPALVADIIESVAAAIAAYEAAQNGSVSAPTVNPVP